MKMMKKRFPIPLIMLVLSACQPQSPQLDILGPVPELGHGLMQGYLHERPPLNSEQFVPAPPADGSAREQADEAASDALRPLEGTARWELAARDAELSFPSAASIFACALGVSVSDSETPALYRLLQRSLTDLGSATYPAKKAYQRSRPFMTNQQAICTPEERALLETDGSYPSGHSAVGWGWALILSQLAPERAEVILSRGRDYARSRMVCNVHWMSDTEAGMTVGAAAFSQLQNNALFQATMTAARLELDAKTLTVPDLQTCAKEAEILAAGR